MGGWTLGQDLRHALRVMRAQPGFAAAAIVMLALGIGATTAIFSVVKAVLINPLPYANADALVRLSHNIGGIDQPYFNDAIYLTYAESSQAFESVGVWSPEGTGVTITGRGDPEEARALSASRGLFTTLGVQPEIGRWFSVEEDVPGSPRTVMLGAGYWRRRFGGDASVVGQSIVINGQPHQIIGVMPARFTFGGEFDVMLPLRINPARPVPFFYLNGVARMKPGVTLEAAKADISRVLETYFDKYKANTRREVTLGADPRAAEAGGGRRCGPNTVGVDGNHRHRAADGVRERRQPVVDPRRVTAAGIRNSRSAGRAVDAGGAVAARREHGPRRLRRRAGSRPRIQRTPVAGGRRAGERAEAIGDRNRPGRGAVRHRHHAALRRPVQPHSHREVLRSAVCRCDRSGHARHQPDARAPAIAIRAGGHADGPRVGLARRARG